MWLALLLFLILQRLSSTNTVEFRGKVEGAQQCNMIPIAFGGDGLWGKGGK